MFESISYVDVDDQERIMLNDTRKKMIFVGCDKKSKEYKFYTLNEWKMVISRDVEIYEKRAWDWKIDDSEKYDFLPVFDEEKEDH